MFRHINLCFLLFLLVFSPFAWPIIKQVSEMVFIPPGETYGNEKNRNSLRIFLDFVLPNPQHFEEHREFLEGGERNEIYGHAESWRNMENYLSRATGKGGGGGCGPWRKGQPSHASWQCLQGSHKTSELCVVHLGRGTMRMSPKEFCGPRMTWTTATKRAMWAETLGSVTYSVPWVVRCLNDPTVSSPRAAPLCQPPGALTQLRGMQWP